MKTRIEIAPLAPMLEMLPDGKRGYGYFNGGDVAVFRDAQEREVGRAEKWELEITDRRFYLEIDSVPQGAKLVDIYVCFKVTPWGWQGVKIL